MTRNSHRIIELEPDDCRELMGSQPAMIGRVAFAEGGDPNWPTVLPVNYLYRDGAVYFRTFEGSKLYAALRHQRIAFEVDHVDGNWHEGWSVVALGTLDVVHDDELLAAIDADLTSWAAGEDELVVGLTVEQLSGRRVFGPSPP